MNRSGRRVAAPMKNESQKLLWLGVTIAAPSAGMCSAPVIYSRNQTRMKATTTPRTSAYSTCDGPCSRARRWASSLVTQT